MGSIANSVLYGVSESAQTEGSYKLLRITDIQNNSVSWENVPFTTLPKDKVSEYLLKPNDILFARTGATVGKSYLVNEVDDNVIYASYLIRVRLFELFESQYIKFYFESGFYWGQIIDKSVGVGQPNVNGTSLKSLLIPIPPYKEQSLIGKRALELTDIIENINNAKKDISNYIQDTKSKILDLAIRGKLVPQDPNDEPASLLLERINSEHSDSKKKTKNTGDNSHYTDTFDIPNNWVVTTMQEVCYLSDGEKIEGKALPYLDVKYLRGKSEPKILSSGRFVEGNNFMILVDGENSGEIFSVTEDGYQGSTFKILNISKQINEAFIFKLLQNEQTTFKESKVGSAIPHLNKKLFRELYVFLPPLSEQKRIVKKIEEIFASLDEIANSI